jgi:hypothetical protein
LNCDTSGDSATGGAVGKMVAGRLVIGAAVDGAVLTTIVGAEVTGTATSAVDGGSVVGTDAGVLGAVVEGGKVTGANVTDCDVVAGGTVVAVTAGMLVSVMTMLEACVGDIVVVGLAPLIEGEGSPVCGLSSGCIVVASVVSPSPDRGTPAIELISCHTGPLKIVSEEKNDRFGILLVAPAVFAALKLLVMVGSVVIAIGRILSDTDALGTVVIADPGCVLVQVGTGVDCRVYVEVVTMEGD